MGGERTWCAAERERWDKLLLAFEEREPILTLWRALWAFAVLSGSFLGFERLVWAVLIHCPLHWFPCQIWYHSLMHIFATHIWCTLQPSSICIEVLLKCFPTVKHQVWALRKVVWALKFGYAGPISCPPYSNLLEVLLHDELLGSISAFKLPFWRTRLPDFTSSEKFPSSPLSVF